MTRLLIASIAIGSTLLLSGCSSSLDKWQKNRPKLVKAAGTLKFNEQPVSDAVVTFYPVTGAHSAFARTDSYGNFELTTFDPQDGAVPGDYQVTVSKLEINYEPDPDSPQHKPPLYHAERSLVPDRFADVSTSDLKQTIPDSGTTSLDLAVTGSEGKLKVLADRRGKQ